MIDHQSRSGGMQIKLLAQQVVTTALDLLFPPHCVGCERVGEVRLRHIRRVNHGEGLSECRRHRVEPGIARAGRVQYIAAEATHGELGTPIAAEHPIGNVSLDGKRLKPMRIRRLDRRRLRFELTEGKKHQNRRVCRMVGLEVEDLHRIRIGSWELGDLPEGQWRLLPPEQG